VDGVAGSFDHAVAGLGEMGTHLVGQAGEFHVVFARHQVDRATEFLETRPERGQGARADVVEAEREAFRVVAVASFHDRAQPFRRQLEQRLEESLIVPILEERLKSAGADEVGQRRVAEASFFAFGGSGQSRTRPDEDKTGDSFRMSEGPMERETAAQGVAQQRDLRSRGRFGDQPEVRLDRVIAKVTLMAAFAVSG
jgi:hypothetical protein